MFVLGLRASGLLPRSFVESLRGFEGEEDRGFQVPDLCLKEFNAIVGRHSVFFCCLVKILAGRPQRHLWAGGSVVGVVRGATNSSWGGGASPAVVPLPIRDPIQM